LVAKIYAGSRFGFGVIHTYTSRVQINRIGKIPVSGCKVHHSILCISSVNIDGSQSFGLIFYSEISELGELPDSEIEEVKLFDMLPENLTYPSIHNVLFNKVVELYGY
jgi:hypothetical protein